jgi:hypothetical protein
VIETAAKADRATIAIAKMMLVVLVARNPQVYLNSLIGDTGPCEYSSSTVKPHI